VLSFSNNIIMKKILIISLLSIGMIGFALAGGDDRDSVAESLDKSSEEDYASFEPDESQVLPQNIEDSTTAQVEQSNQAEQSNQIDQSVQVEQSSKQIETIAEYTVSSEHTVQEIEAVNERSEPSEVETEKVIEEASEAEAASIANEPTEGSNQLQLILFFIGALLAIAFFVRQFQNIRNKKI